MVAIALIFMATIMALFGVLGYLRGTKFGLVISGLILAGLMVMSRGSEQVAKIINGLNFGLRFVLGGGLQALGGSGDKTEAIKKVISQLGDIRPLVSSDQPGVGLLLILALLVGLSLLLSLFKILKGAASLLGLALGLFSGYLIAAYALAALMPEVALLPLPIHLPSLAQVVEAASAAAPAIPSGSGLSAKVGQLLTGLGDDPRLPIIIAVAIALFVILATRLGNRGGKGGSGAAGR